MRSWIKLIGVVTPLSLGACTTTLNHEKLVAGTQPASPGVSYYLPAQRYVVTATYELKSCPNIKGTAAEKKADLVLKQTATITESPIADINEYYSVPINTLTSGWKTTSLTVSLYDNGTLKSIGATVDDQSAAVVTGAVSAAASVARIVIGAPTALADTVPLCTPDVYKALQTVQTSTARLIDPKTDDKERANWAAAIVAAKAVLTISETYIFDPTRTVPGFSGKPGAPALRSWFANPSLIATSAQKDDFTRNLTTGMIVEGYPASVAALPAALDGKGVLYREPAPVRVRVCAGDCTDAKATKLIEIRSTAAQFGRYVALPLKNRPFEKNNLALSFTPGGAVDTMTYGTESRLAKMATSLSGVATSFEDVAAKKRAADKADRATADSAELNAIKAETSLIDAKADKLEAEQRLAKLTGGAE